MSITKDPANKELLKKRRTPQLELLKKQPLAYGGELLKTRKGRAHGRTLDTKNSMHMVLRSSQAKDEWSFSRKRNKQIVAAKFRQFGAKYGVKLQSIAFVGNHLHCQIRLANRHSYAPFIRALTGSIAMAITNVSRWQKVSPAKVGALGRAQVRTQRLKFWDYRPFTRVVRGYRALLTLKDYIQINRLEGYGIARNQAQFLNDFYKYPLDYGERAPVRI